jgi:NADPH:quinone reductase-like Zn-dependent oxidoreductase
VPKAVRFDHYGGPDVLEVVEVDRPVPASGQALVRVKAAGINLGEAKIREGLMHAVFPATFPSGQGSDLAGVIEDVGPDVDGFEAGDEVIGFTDERASQAELVVVEARNLTRRPPNVPWEVAGSLFVVGCTAWAAVRAVSLSPRDTLVISGAAGGVGSLAVQLARRQESTVIGLASERNHNWLSEHGAIPVTYGDGVADRIREAADGRVDAFIDTVSPDYVELALELGVKPERIDMISNPPAGQRLGVKTDGNMVGASPEVLAELARLIERGELELPITRTYPLGEVREAFRELEKRHLRGKIVLIP